MPIRFMMAKDPIQTDQILRLRYDVFHSEEGFFEPTEDQRLIDRFDAFSTTRNIMALSGEEIIGSLRLTLDSPAGMPADSYYDFRRFIPEGALAMTTGMYCVRAAHRNPRIPLNLTMMATYFAVSSGVTHVVAPINPPIAKLVQRVGFEPVDDPQWDPHLGLTFIPVMLDMKNLQDYFLTFAKRNKLYNFLQSYESMVFSRGEAVVTAGEVGQSAFVIIEGEVEVRRAGTEEVLAVMEQGQIFGELALLTDDVRSADVIAKTDLRVMVLPKEAFLEHLATHPQHAIEMLKNMGARMKSLLM